MGTGYFGQRELFFFGSDSGDRDSLISWNTKDFWSGINPPASEGGAVFFGETCFGGQLGFRWSGDACETILFLVDTFETFLMAKDIGDFFQRVLVERGAIDDPALIDALIQRFGVVSPGMHYVPIVSPLIGGSARPDNFHLEPVNIHFRLAIATFRTVEG